jgi:hypothetical protein
VESPLGLLDKLTRKEPEKIEEPETETFGQVDITGLFDPNVKDEKDYRNINASPLLQEAIGDYQSMGNVEKREIFIFDSEMKSMPDFYLPYYWSATYNFDKGNVEEAKKILIEGIKKCMVKSVLCRRLGEYSFLKGDVNDALYWFFTAVMSDTGNIDYHSYSYLAYIYEAYGMTKASEWSLRRARGIIYKLLMQSAEYSEDKKKKIIDIAEKNKSDQTAKKLEDFYSYARPRIKNL